MTNRVDPETGLTPEDMLDVIADAQVDVAALRAQKDGAYRERDQVVALLARVALALGWRAGLRRHEPDPDPTWDEDWKNVVAIDLPTGQVTWHFHDSERPLFHSLPAYPAPWDGHDTAEKYRRVNEAAPAREDATPPAPQPIRWLGDCTDGGDLWELTRRRDRFPILGCPTTLYFRMDDDTIVVVPSGWWIYDWHTEHPRVSSAAPPVHSDTCVGRVHDSLGCSRGAATPSKEDDRG
jgi:hypothetical protein